MRLQGAIRGVAGHDMHSSGLGGNYSGMDVSYKIFRGEIIQNGTSNTIST